jgi:hypothetical protein
MPDYKYGLRPEIPKPNEIRTVRREAYLKNMANIIKRIEYVDSKISNVRITVYWD